MGGCVGPRVGLDAVEKKKIQEKSRLKQKNNDAKDNSLNYSF